MKTANAVKVALNKTANEKFLGLSPISITVIFEIINVEIM
jgi:hypothetical protein